MNYAEQIYKFRKEEGISQEALAVAIGTTRQQISRWECGCSIPSMKYITLMVEYFHTDIHTFMGTDMGEESKEAIDYDGKQSDSFTKMMGILSILFSCLYFIFGTLFEISGRIMFVMSRAGATIEDGQYSLFETEQYSNQIRSILLRDFILVAILFIGLGTILYVHHFIKMKNKIYKYTAYKFYTLFLSISLGCITGYLYKLLRFPYASMGYFDFFSYYCGMFLFYRSFFTFITMLLQKVTKDKIMVFEPSKRLYRIRIIYVLIMLLLIVFFLWEILLNAKNPNSFIDYYFLGILYFPLSFIINIVFEILFLTIKDKNDEIFLKK